MRNNSDMKELAEGIKGLFRERYGEFRAEDFVAVTDMEDAVAAVRKVMRGAVKKS